MSRGKQPRRYSRPLPREVVDAVVSVQAVFPGTRIVRTGPDTSGVPKAGVCVTCGVLFKAATGQARCGQCEKEKK